MLKNEMWKVFKATGSINAYLYYKDSTELEKEKIKNEAKEEKMIQGL